METIVGVGLGIFIPVFAALVGLDRDRAFYPTVLIVIASYYVLFAAMAGSVQAAMAEIAAMALFMALALAGFKLSLWWAVLGLFAHGVFDFTHGLFIENAGVPLWWPAFCSSIDVVTAAVLGFLLKREAGRAGRSRLVP